MPKLNLTLDTTKVVVLAGVWDRCQRERNASWLPTKAKPLAEIDYPFLGWRKNLGYLAAAMGRYGYDDLIACRDMKPPGLIRAVIRMLLIASPLTNERQTNAHMSTSCFEHFSLLAALKPDLGVSLPVQRLWSKPRDQFWSRRLVCERQLRGNETQTTAFRRRA